MLYLNKTQEENIGNRDGFLFIRKTVTYILIMQESIITLQKSNNAENWIKIILKR